MAPPLNTAQKFWSRTQKTDTCWLWKGTRTLKKHGKTRGLFSFHGSYRQVHRLAYEFCYGSIENGLYVLHKCDVTDCVNPSHLFLGTHRDNMEDMKKKGRSAKGSKHGRAKITESNVQEMRRQYYAGVKSGPTLASEYGLSISTTMDAIRKISWKHV